MKNLIFTLFFLLLSFPVFSQTSATVNATANVYTPLSVTVQQDLDFGGLVAGQTKTVLADDTRSAIIFIDGVNSTAVDVAFTLPANLVNTGGDNLSVSFSATSAGRNTINDKQSLTVFDPNSGTTTPLSGIGELYVYLGGTLTATGLQPTGTYTGTIQVSVSYN